MAQFKISTGNAKGKMEGRRLHIFIGRKNNYNNQKKPSCNKEEDFKEWKIPPDYLVISVAINDLPLQMPINMQAVEKQQGDVPLDMKCYTDADGQVYDFGFGLNWKGVIKDVRTAKYKAK